MQFVVLKHITVLSFGGVGGGFLVNWNGLMALPFIWMGKDDLRCYFLCFVFLFWARSRGELNSYLKVPLYCEVPVESITAILEIVSRVALHCEVSEVDCSKRHSHILTEMTSTASATTQQQKAIGAQLSHSQIVINTFPLTSSTFPPQNVAVLFFFLWDIAATRQPLNSTSQPPTCNEQASS